MTTCELSPSRAETPEGTTGDIWRGGLSVVDQAIVSACSFGTAVLVGRFTGPGELARYTLVLTVVTTLCVVQESLVSAPFNVFLARAHVSEHPAATRRALRMAAALAITAAGIAAAIGLLGHWIVPATLPGPIAALAAILIPAVLLRDFARRALAARLDILGALRLDALVAFVQIGALALLAWTGSVSVRYAIFVSSAASTAGVLYWFGRVRTRARALAIGLATSWREYWRLGRWILAGRLVGQLNSDTLLLWVLVPIAGMDSAGVFAACLGIALLSNPVVLGLGTYFAPRLAHAYPRQGLRTLRRVTVLATVLIAALMSVVVGLTWLIGSWLLRVLYGDAFSGHGGLVVTLSAALATSAIGMVANHALVALERPQRNVTANLAGLAVLMCAAAALIPRFAEAGAAVALWAGYAAASATRWALLAGVSDEPSTAHAAVASGLAGGQS